MPYEVTYGKQRTYKVDYIVRAGNRCGAIEVKSSRPRSLGGLARFRADHPHARPLLVGPGGISLEEFFLTDLREIFVE